MNLYGNEWDLERSPTGYGEKLMHLGRRLGGELIGATMFEVEPGWRSLYHVHHGNEELVLVVDGNPTVRTGGGERSSNRAMPCSSSAAWRARTRSRTVATRLRAS